MTSQNNTIVLAGPADAFSATELDDLDNNAHTITSGGQVAFNSTPIAGTANVVQLAYENGTVWQQNEAGNWYSIINDGNGNFSGVGPTTVSPISLQTITLPPNGPNTTLQAGQDLGDSFILSNSNFPQHVEFDILGSDTVGTLTADGTPGINGTAPVTGSAEVFQGAGVNLDVQGGVQISEASVDQFVQDSGTLSLEGTTTLNMNGFYSPSVTDDNGSLLLNGTIDVGALGKNVLSLTDINVVGGLIVESGENDTIDLGQGPPKPGSDDEEQTGTVTGTDFRLDAGVLNFLYPKGFNGTIGPLDSPLANDPSMVFSRRSRLSTQ
jgi:hypothetical protein